MRQVAVPQWESLHQNPSLQQGIEGDVSHQLFSLIKIPSRAFQHHGKIKVAIRTMITARARAEKDRLLNFVGIR